VILDLELPGKSGTDVYADIAAEHPDIKVLLSSGQTLGPAAEKLLNDGAVGFLQKPYDLWELRRAVLKAIAPPESE
jgi:FixJ family two-component response regulator